MSGPYGPNDPNGQWAQGQGNPDPNGGYGAPQVGPQGQPGQQYGQQPWGQQPGQQPQPGSQPQPGLPQWGQAVPPQWAGQQQQPQWAGQPQPGQPQPGQQQWGQQPGQPQWGPPGQGQTGKSKAPIFIGIGVIVLIIAVVGAIFAARALGSDTLDQTAAQEGVTTIVTESYGAEDVEGVSCPADQEVKKGNSFDCDLTVDGEQKSVTLTFTDDEGTYEVSRPS
ncbi:DUF4333 domain-containing protein [Rhodococcus sp. NPDC058521]|uniref:DUF4333 domain-containing protein n=1 Tax=Rhodococcus sp. NPDC058521 TaxID=3346536 RepID=UPI0036562A39